MFKKSLALVLLICATITLSAAPPQVRKMRQQMVERELARSYYTQKLQELQNQEQIFKKSQKPMKDRQTGLPIFSKKF